MEQSKRRLDYIDTAKAVAIISVVVGHVLLWNLYGPCVWKKSLLMSIVCSYHNYLFIFLSGVVSVTAIDKTKILADIYKRFRCLLVPAFAVVIPFTLVVGADISHFFLDAMKWGYWYLFVLFGLYIICYPFAIIPAKYMKWLCVLVVPVWLFVYRHTYLIPQEIKNLLEVDLIVQYFPYFFVGSIVKRFGLHDRLFSLPVLATCIAVTAFQSQIFELTGRYLVEYIVTFAEVIGIVTLCKYMEKISKHGWLLFIGRSTLFIYLFHYIAIELMKPPVAQDWFAENGNLGIDVLAAMGPTIAAIVFSLAVKWLFERSPFLMKWVFNVSYTGFVK